jgi:hypothetical protein
VDHVEALANGGEDDPSNLVTACSDCNLGKSAVPLTEKRLAVGMVTEADLDHAEQIQEYLAVQREIARARIAIIDELLAYWTERCGSCIPRDLPVRLPAMLKEFGVARMMEAIDIVGRKMPERGGSAPVMYLHGILRKWRTESDRPETSRDPYLLRRDEVAQNRRQARNDILAQIGRVR